jgi:FkbM family methyltransferase
MPTAEMNLSTYLRAHAARVIGTIFCKVFGHSIPVFFQRLVRFTYCPWIGRGEAFKKIVKIPGTTNSIELNTFFYTDWQVWCYGAPDVAIEKKITDFNCRGKVFFDIGANFGYYSALANGQGATVYSFEPVAAIYNRLTKINELNGKNSINTFQLACSDKKENIEISIPDASNPNWGQSSILRQIGNNTEFISTVTLDEFCAERKLEELSLIKIDVEGAEHLVLKGSQNVLHKYRPVVIFEGNDESLHEASAILRACNYNIEKLHRNSCDFIATPN